MCFAFHNLLTRLLPRRARAHMASRPARRAVGPARISVVDVRLASLDLALIQLPSRDSGETLGERS